VTCVEEHTKHLQKHRLQFRIITLTLVQLSVCFLVFPTGRTCDRPCWLVKAHHLPRLCGCYSQVSLLIHFTVSYTTQQSSPVYTAAVALFRPWRNNVAINANQGIRGLEREGGGYYVRVSCFSCHNANVTHKTPVIQDPRAILSDTLIHSGLL
jgi:hypothetical protein